MLDDQQKQTLRHVVREVLAARHPAALPVAAIMRRAAMEIDFAINEDDTESALRFLESLEEVRSLPDALGSANYFTATAMGVLAHERVRKNRKS